MMSRTFVAIVLGIGLAGAAAGQDQAAKPPRVEIVFVLDTTGSMGGLIEGAKKKIWAIATEIERGTPKPELFAGLIGYRDKNDAYVTKVTALTENLDLIYTNLVEFQAQGGGDEPENVRQALHEALTKIEWSKDKDTLRIIFLVGDAPPHMDYTDVPAVEDLCASAAKAGIIINTVRCGTSEETGRIWQQIAAKSEGKYVSIDQGGGVLAVATPFDKELAELSDKLGRTVIAWGSRDKRRAAEECEKRAEGYGDDAKADRAACKAAGVRYSADDLIDALREKRVKLEDVKDEELPDDMKKMNMEERRAYVEKRGKEREELRARVVEVSKKRDAFIAEELRKRGTRDAFDEVVLKAVREQAERKGIHFEEKK